MQLDMHYYGTWHLARAAGLAEPICTTIATAAQFVDDNAVDDGIEFLDGARIDVQATAHHPAKVLIQKVTTSDAYNAASQRNVWVPYHFFPGNEGTNYHERMICRLDSQLAREMVKRNLQCAKKSYGALLLGITAHVYADTFAHYGFSGISSSHNKVDGKSFEFHETLDPDVKDYITKKANAFFKSNKTHGRPGKIDTVLKILGTSKFATFIKGKIGTLGSGALGHGAVATFPDRPYLVWSFDYEAPARNKERRDNPDTYILACEALFNMFCEAGEIQPHWRDTAPPKFDALKPVIKGVLATEGPKEKRIQAWQDCAASGQLPHGDVAPDYNVSRWVRQRDKLHWTCDSREAIDTDLYKFYQAAADHRTFVLRDLMPGNDLVID